MRTSAEPCCHAPCAMNQTHPRTTFDRLTSDQPPRNNVGVAKRVGDPLCGDRVLGIAGVADQRPAWPVRNSQVVAYGTAEERCLAPRRPDARRKLRDEIQCAVVVD